MQNQGQGKFKTMLCKHFETPKGCVYKDKCQFAHGAFELKSVVNNMYNQNSFPRQQNTNTGFNKPNHKKVPNPSNYKIVKCKNFEKDGACKYGNTCTFAHGDTEVRNKTENMGFSNPQFGMNPQMMGMFNPYMMDPMLMGMGMGMPTDMAQMGVYPNMMGLDPNNASATPAPGQNQPMQDFQGGINNMAFYQNMYSNPQQVPNQNNQQLN